MKHTLDDLDDQVQRNRQAYSRLIAILNLSLCVMAAILITLTAVLILA